MRPRLGPIVVEVVATARAARAHAAIFLLVGLFAAGTTTWVAGTTASQRVRLRADLERPDLRTAVLASQDGIPLDPGLVARARALSISDAVWATGAIVDVRNAGLLEGAPVAGRTLFGGWRQLPIELASGRWPVDPTEAVVDVGGAADLRLADGLGAVRSASGGTWAIVGTYRRDHLRSPSGVLHPPTAGQRPVSASITVPSVADLDRIDGDLARAIAGVGGPIGIERAGEVGALARSLEATTGEGTAVVLTSVAASTVLVLSVVSLLVVLVRRTELGRRRAIGASRTTVALLVVLQGLLLLLAGTAAGTVLALAAAVWWSDVHLPLLPAAGMAASTCLVGILAQLPAALLAAWRDPVRVLRTP